MKNQKASRLDKVEKMLDQLGYAVMKNHRMIGAMIQEIEKLKGNDNDENQEEDELIR